MAAASRLVETRLAGGTSTTAASLAGVCDSASKKRWLNTLPELLKKTTRSVIVQKPPSRKGHYPLKPHKTQCFWSQ